MKMQKWIMGVLLISAAHQLHAAGYAIYEASAKGNAMAGALLGGADDASNAHFNPAAMTEVPGLAVMSGATLIAPTARVRVQGQPYDLDPQYFVLPHAYATYGLNDWLWSGFSLHVPYGTGTDYPSSMPTLAKLYSTATYMESMEAMPSLAFKVTEDFSVAAGARAIWTKTTIRHQIYSPLQLAYPFPVEHQTEAIGYGYVVSGLYHITDDLDAGLVYRSRVREDSSGTSSGWPNHSYGMDALVTLPDSWEGGLNYKLTKAWEIGCSAIYTGWSSYSDLILEIPGMPPNSASPTGNEINSRKDWKDVWRLGLGTSYALSSSWTVMGGYTYDWSPIPESRADFMMPPGNRHLLGTGLAYTLAPFTLTLGYNFLLMESSQSEAMHSTLGTVYFDHCYAHMVSVSLGANF
jgi:long-chain fatty acid transport protein